MNTYAAVFVFAMIVIFVTLLMTLGLYVVSALAQYRLLRRAGHAYPASAWVPFWNTWTLFELGGQHPAWSLLALGSLLTVIPYLGAVISFAAAVLSYVIFIMAAININKAVGRGTTGWHVFAALLPTIWLWVIGFSSTRSPWDPARRNGPFFPGAPRTVPVPPAGPYPYPYGAAGYPQAPYGQPSPGWNPSAAPGYPQAGGYPPPGYMPPAPPATPPQSYGQPAPFPAVPPTAAPMPAPPTNTQPPGGYAPPPLPPYPGPTSYGTPPIPPAQTPPAQPPAQPSAAQTDENGPQAPKQ